MLSQEHKTITAQGSCVFSDCFVLLVNAETASLGLQYVPYRHEKGEVHPRDVRERNYVG